MSDKETTEYKPNEKEMRLFEQEKIELYKGSFFVCLVYGLAAFILLAIILFTEWGKVYIYDKFAPAVITYMLGTLIIIVYLLNEIFTLKPRKIGADIDGDSNIMCPDFWKLEKVEQQTKEDIINNNIFDINKHIIPKISRDANMNIQYRCKADDNVFGTTQEYYDMKNFISPITKPYMVGFDDRDKAIKYEATAKLSGTRKNTESPDYIVALPDKSAPNYNDLKRYAQFSGAYNKDNPNIYDAATSTTLKIASEDYLKGTKEVPNATAYTKYEETAPLICNVVYPQVLGLLDSTTKEKNEVSCEYAKQCGISWSSLKCT